MLTSSSRTAWCGPACQVVWQGRSPRAAPYADLSGDKKSAKNAAPLLPFTTPCPAMLDLGGKDPNSLRSNRGLSESAQLCASRGVLKGSLSRRAIASLGHAGSRRLVASSLAMRLFGGRLRRA